jgi:Carboxypeptidase regulatory-like domain/TonB dependent receptor
MTANHKCFLPSVVFALCLFATTTLYGQIDRGAISGTITDPAGAVVQGATVTVTNTGTGQITTLTTGSDGSYTARSLHIGTYSVEARSAGFRNTLQTGIQLDVNQVVQVDLKLALGTANEIAQVTGAAPLLATETSSLGTVETQERIENLPLNGRLFTQLAWLGPGTSPGSSSGIGLSGSTDDNRPGIQLAVNGLWAFDNNFLLDGVDNNGIGDGTIAVNPSPDAIGEFRVEENSMKAEFGRGGAAVNAALKSGTNQVHGGLFEYMRNDVLDARNYFNNATKAPLHRNQFGAFIGGPIIKNHTFFFADYQGSRLHEGLTDTSTVPTAPERTGDFTDRGIDLYNPYTTTTTTVDGQTQYVRQLLNPSNPSVIPTGMIDQIGQNLVNLFPQPNLPSTANNCNGLCNNFMYNPVATWTGDQFDVRIDHKIGDHDQLFGHASYENRPQYAPVPLPGEAEGCCGGNQNTREQNYAVGYTHTFGTNVLNDLRFAFIRYGVHSTPVDFGQNISDQVGIPNANRGNEETSGLATINISNYSNLGNSGWIPELSADNTYQIADSLSWVKGKHTIKVGVDYRKYQRNFFQSQAAFGQFQFSGQLTQDLTGVDPNGGGNALADLLLGLPVYREQDGLEYKDDTRFFELGEFAQDDIRVNNKLTVNVGLRYDIFSPIGGKVGNFDLNTAVVNLNFGPGAIKNAGVAYEKNDWGPRIGFAWSPFDDRKTVISSAFGIFYAPEGNQFNDIGENPPNLQYFAQNTPAYTIPSLPTMIDSGFPTVLPTSDPASPSGQVKTTGPVRKAPRVLEYNLTLQRQLARDWTLNVAYVGTRATGIWNNEDSNLDQPQQPLDSNFSDATGNMGRPYFSVLPNLSVINPIDYPNFDINFQGLETKLEKHFSTGFTFLGSYTWAHTTGSWQGAHTGNTQIADDPNAQRGNVDPDYRHRFTASYTYELPFGHGRKFGSGMGGFENAVAGGWQVGGITTIRSGEHYTPFLGYDDTNTGTAAMPDMIHNPYDFSFDTADQANVFQCPNPGHQSLSCFYNPAAFVIPPLAPGQGSAHEFGTARDGSLVGPDQVNFDFSAFKNFAITERHQIQFRAEFFNIFNHPQFSLPGRNPNNVGGASITGTLPDNQREVQFALRYTF